MQFNPASVSEKLVGVPGRTPSLPASERELGFYTLSPYRDGVITLGKFAGTSAWERHPKGDEIVQVVTGNIILRIDADSIKLGTGDMTVIPAGRWHQIYAAEMASMLYVTPRPTEHFEGDILGRQLDPLKGPGAWLLSAFVHGWHWLRR